MEGRRGTEEEEPVGGGGGQSVPDQKKTQW